MDKQRQINTGCSWSLREDSPSPKSLDVPLEVDVIL